LLRRKLELEPDPVAPQSAPAQPPTSPAEGISEAAVATTPAGLFEDFAGEITGIEPAHRQEAVIRIVAAARYLRRQDAASPASYLILRALRWGELRACGPEVDASLLVAPTTEVRTRMKTLAAKSRWPELLDLAESVAATECGRGWLDLQRYAVTALENLGHKTAAEAVKSELACLLADYPKLASATLLDDTGAANPETASWLSATILNRNR
jgi:hypothetical protein